MDLLAFLSLGFFVGMGHALEADHLAAVATMLQRQDGRRSLILRGAIWGVGHTLSLFVICSAVILLGMTVSGTVEAALELSVGLMIIVLGAQVIWRLRREKMHIHAHEHDGVRHLHVHSHATDTRPHAKSAHRHAHRPFLAHRKALLIGLLHGAAGSAGLLVLMVASTQSAAGALTYFLVFGIGSILGMAALSAVASYPLIAVQRGAVWLRNATTAAIGAGAIWVGGHLALESLATLGLVGG
jgi:ABC-type nickel/cobalt efflux system permease component RcnA